MEKKIIQLIHHLYHKSNDIPGYNGLGDDSASLIGLKQLPNIFSTDQMVENIHFKRHWSFKNTGIKCLRRAFSDILAMGAIPQYALLNIVFPKTKNNKLEEQANFQHIEEFLKGFALALNEYNAHLIGGDTSAGDHFHFSVTALGKNFDSSEKEASLWRRKSACENDVLWSTDIPGKAYLGFLGVEKYQDRFFQGVCYLQQMIKLKNSGIKISSATDCSDGFILDARELLQENQSFLIENKPFENLDSRIINEGIFFGDDYDLLFTAPKSETEKLLALNLIPLGEVIIHKGRQFFWKNQYLKNKNSSSIDLKGFQH